LWFLRDSSPGTSPKRHFLVTRNVCEVKTSCEWQTTFCFT
jgi:hypothetical protein